MILVLSLEIMFRSVRKPRFKPRGRWTVLGCVAIVILFMLALWLVAFLSKTVDSCWGSLLWWTLHYGRPALALTAGTMFTNLVTAIILVVQLVKTIQMDKSERIAASRVVYSLGMNFVILVSQSINPKNHANSNRHSFYPSGSQSSPKTSVAQPRR